MCAAVTPHPSIYRVSCYGCGRMYVRKTGNEKCPYCPHTTIKFYECKCAVCGNTVKVNSFDDPCKFCGTRGKWIQGSYDGKTFKYVTVKIEAPKPAPQPAPKPAPKPAPPPPANDANKKKFVVKFDVGDRQQTGNPNADCNVA